MINPKGCHQERGPRGRGLPSTSFLPRSSYPGCSHHEKLSLGESGQWYVIRLIMTIVCPKSTLIRHIVDIHLFLIALSDPCFYTLHCRFGNGRCRFDPLLSGIQGVEEDCAEEVCILHTPYLCVLPYDVVGRLVPHYNPLLHYLSFSTGSGDSSKSPHPDWRTRSNTRGGTRRQMWKTTSQSETTGGCGHK